MTLHSRRFPPDPAPVGREHELRELQHCYAAACRGEQRLLFVSGEAGIGKTTLVETWLRTLSADTGARVSTGSCIEHYGAGEPYLPILQALRRLCSDPAGDEVVACLARKAPTWLPHLPHPAATPPPQPAESHSARMLRELLDLLNALSVSRPLILVLEDLHWSDPSTVEALAMLARQPGSGRLLLIGTCRDMELLAQHHPLGRLKRHLALHGQCQEIALRCLDRESVQRYLHRRLPEPAASVLADPIHRRTDGQPLYLVMLVDYLCRHGSLDSFLDDTLPAPPDALEAVLPDDLRAAIALQFEHLDEPQQRVLEAASLVGVEFDLANVAAVTGLSEQRLEDLCERLSTRGQFINDLGSGYWPDGTDSRRYGFNHGLFPEVIAGRIDGRQRRRWHQAIGERLERGFAGQTRRISADLARHFTHSGDHQRALRYRWEAADQARWRFANQEAVHHLEAALGLLRRQPQGPTRDRQELALLLQLGPALVATRGYAATGVAAVYERAHELSRRCGDDRRLALTQRGLWVFHCVRGDYRRAFQVGVQMLALARRSRDPADLLEARRALGGILLYRGDFRRAHRQLQRGLALADTPPAQPADAPMINSPGLACGYFQAITLWLLGHDEQALVRIHAVVEHTRELAHPYTLSCALAYRSYLYQHRRDPSATRASAEALQVHSREHGFYYWAAIARMLRGWALALETQPRAGLAELEQGLAAFDATGAGMLRPYFLGLLAEARACCGDPHGALVNIAEALALIARTGEGYHEAELHRLRGEFLQQQPGAPPGAAEQSLRSALAIARRQRAPALALRAATDLARLWGSRGEREAARGLLAEACRGFTEGVDAPDLRAAGAVLAELG